MAKILQKLWIKWIFELTVPTCIVSKDLTTVKKKLPPVGLDLMQEIITGLLVQCLTNWAKLACVI